jgi:uncharacterized protein YjbI with pentapeptide repeats
MCSKIAYTVFKGWRTIAPTKLADGQRRNIMRISQETLSRALADNYLAIESKGKQGKFASFRGHSMVGLYFHRAFLPGITLRDCNLAAAELGGTLLINADLSLSDLTKANLTGAELRGADLSDADLSGADLSGADLTEANLSNANLSGAILNGTILTRATVYGADFTGAKFVCTVLNSVDLSGAYFRDAYLAGLDPLVAESIYDNM